MSLLENAASSIRIGVQDYQLDDSARVLSAVRNITAGVLLLFKEKLRRLSPPDSDEVLLKQRVLPAKDEHGVISFRGFGKKTVDVQQIIERFNSLEIDVNWKPVENIVSIRNDVEHYFTGETAARLRELIADTFIIVRDFTTTHLGVTPLELLGEETWQHLLTVGEVYQREQHECAAARATLEWPKDLRELLDAHLRCPQCTSELLRPMQSADPTIFITKFKCSSCDKETDYDDLVDEAVDSRYGVDAFVAAKDGGDPPFVECPDCSKDTYLLDHDVCAACGYERQYDECAVCHTPLSIDEQVLGGICSYHKWQLDKDD